MYRAPFLLLVGLLLGCEANHATSDEEAAVNKEIENIRKANPGLKEACLKKLGTGAIGASEWMNNPDCFDMMPPQRWRGLWNSGWEWSNFCPVPAASCSIAPDHGGIWLTFPAPPTGEETDGVYQIEFVGRRTRVPGHFGHLGQYEHLIVVDRQISNTRMP